MENTCKREDRRFAALVGKTEFLIRENRHATAKATGHRPVWKKSHQFWHRHLQVSVAVCFL